MNSLYVVQLEARLGLLIAETEEERSDGTTESRRIEIPLRTASPAQRDEWQRLAGDSAIGLYRLLREADERTIRPKRRKSGSPSEREASGDGEPGAGGFEAKPPAPEDRRGAEDAGAAGTAARTELPFPSCDAAWELTAEAGGGPEVSAALAAAAEAARTRLAFGLTLAGVDPGELAGEALAAWSDGWAAAPDEAAPKAAPRASAESGGREIAEWIASAAEKGVLHEHGRLPEEPAADAAAGAEIPSPGDLSLLPEAAKAEAALAELRRAMQARLRK
ncbi:hypothetical protein CDO73_21425 [Saccharibacillus sp. O23]|uniref:hypothetical protein n=1 Tax=Saccharibacillus sp. O23 TaxID=2009338 RepID=UPI000B4E3CCC|nr:hypothetical protein [Saccharibacillus sp. O23]OWR27750.1 hypothetical protein CDO73_21425 [Saccharibacillus sp. O23]